MDLEHGVPEEQLKQLPEGSLVAPSWWITLSLVGGVTAASAQLASFIERARVKLQACVGLGPMQIP